MLIGIDYCCADHGKGPAIPNTTNSGGTNSNSNELSRRSHDSIKNLLGTSLLKPDYMGYNAKFTEFMRNLSLGSHPHNDNGTLVVFEHNNRAYAVLINLDQNTLPIDFETLLTKHITFTESTPVVSNDGPPMYVAYLGLTISSSYSVSHAVKECFPTKNKFSMFKRNTNVDIKDVMTIEKNLKFLPSIPQESCHLGAQPIVAQPSAPVKTQCC
tara:strand:+ start:595 stop:1233 length:639 start_codon:yes stop_codon:yes gene_type:complete